MQGSVGNQVYCLEPFGYEELDVTNTAIGFTASLVNRCQMVRLQASAGEMMYRFDGTNQTSGVGVPLYEGDKMEITRKEALKVKFIRVGVTNGKIRAHFYD